MGTCAVIKEIFAYLARLDRISINNPAEIIFAFPHARMGTRCLAVMHLEIHHFQHFYSIDTATAPTNTALMWAKSLRRFAELCLRHETHTRLLISQLTERGKTQDPTRGQKFNTIVAPLASLNIRIRWSDDIYENSPGRS
jgi:hypothetical protein